MICSTNHSLWNFLEYQLRGSQNRCFAPPKFEPTVQTSLNNNYVASPKFHFLLTRRVQLKW